MVGTFSGGIPGAAWGKLSPRTRRLLLGVVAALLAWLGLAAFVLPQRAARLRLEEEVRVLVSGTQALRQQIEVLKSGARGEDAIRAALVAAHRELEESLARVPENRALSSALRDLTAPESEDGMTFLSITPHPPEKRGELRELPFTLELEGTYRSVTLYLAHLEALPRLVAVQRVNLESLPGGKRGELHASITAAVYVLEKNP